MISIACKFGLRRPLSGAHASELLLLLVLDKSLANDTALSIIDKSGPLDNFADRE